MGTIRINRETVIEGSGHSRGIEFRYIAMDSTGKESGGIVRAGSQEQAIRAIRERGLFPTKLDPVSPLKVEKPQSVCGCGVCGCGAGPRLPFFVRVSRREKAVFARNLAAMVDSGIPLLRGLRVMQGSERNRSLKAACYGMGAAVERGSTFSEALAMYPKIFDGVFVNMVRAGEAGGVLEIVLERLASHLEKHDQVRSSVRCSVIGLAGAAAMAAVVAMLCLPSVLGINAATMMGLLAVVVVPPCDRHGRILLDIPQGMGQGQIAHPRVWQDGS